MMELKFLVRAVRFKSGGAGRSRAGFSGGVKGRVPKQNTKKDALEEPRPFGVGKFPNLKYIPSSMRQRPKSIEDKDGLDHLKIFPSVREAMVQEIRRLFDLKKRQLQQLKSVDEIKIIPTSVQISAIQSLTKSRLSSLSKRKIKEIEGNESFELTLNNLNRQLKVFTIAAETGSGKTWAYLAPLLSKLKDKELELFKQSPESYSCFKKQTGVRSIILVPTAELVDQVYQTLVRTNEVQLDGYLHPKLLNNLETKEFFELPEQKDSLHMNIQKWSSGENHFTLMDEAKKNGIDVLVTTPSKLETISRIKNISNPWSIVRNTEFVVFDEADTLMDPSWAELSINCIQKIPNMTDLVFVSATIPRSFTKTLQKLFPGENSVTNIFTPGLHRISKKIHMKILDAQLPPYNGSKTRCLAQALYAIQKDGSDDGFVKRVLIFVNERTDVLPLRDTLVQKYGHDSDDVVCLSGSDSLEERQKKLDPFINFAAESKEPKLKVLIATDILSRGMNFVGVKNVILMDLPDRSTDLVHRCGRTGRMRQLGRVFVIIDQRTKKGWIKGLPKIIKNGVSIG